MLSALDLTFRLGAAVLVGSLIGIDREVHAKPVGIVCSASWVSDLLS